MLMKNDSSTVAQVHEMPCFWVSQGNGYFYDSKFGLQTDRNEAKFSTQLPLSQEPRGE